MANLTTAAARLLTVLGLLACCWLGSCAGTPFKYSVNAYARPDAACDVQYWLVAGSEDIDEHGLEFAEFSKYVHQALRERGFQEASRLEDADVVIAFAYSIGEGETYQSSYSVPIYGDKGGETSKTIGTYNAYSGHYSTTTTTKKEQGIVGYDRRTVTQTLYPRSFEISAFAVAENEAASASQTLWEVSVISVGSLPDLRRVFPVLVYAARDRMATNTSQWVEGTVYEKSSKYQEFRRAAVE